MATYRPSKNSIAVHPLRRSKTGLNDTTRLRSSQFSKNKLFKPQNFRQFFFVPKQKFGRKKFRFFSSLWTSVASVSFFSGSENVSKLFFRQKKLRHFGRNEFWGKKLFFGVVSRLCSEVVFTLRILLPWVRILDTLFCHRIVSWLILPISNLVGGAI